MAAKSIKRNYFYNAIYNILMLLTPLITAPYISRVLKADGVGTVSFVASIVQYFIIFSDFGTGSYGQREISYSREDLDRRSTAFWETFSLRAFNSLIALTVYLSVVAFFVKSYRVIFLIYAINIINVAFDVSWFFGGLEEFGKIIFRNTLVRVADVAFVFIFIRSQSDLPLYVCGASLFTLLGSLVMWRDVHTYVSKPKLETLRPFRNIRTVLSLFLPTIAIQVYTVLDKSMLGWFIEGTFENGYYEQSMKLSKLTLAFITSLVGVMVPRIGYLFEKNDHEQIRAYMYRSYNFVWFLSVALCFGIIGISDNFVPWFFGPGYDKVAGLLKISSFLIIIIGFGSTNGGQYFVPTKRQNLFTYSVMAGAVINFSMNIFLIRMYQSYGAMFASVVAEIAVTSIQFWLMRHEISVVRVVKSGVNYIVAGVIMLAVLVFMSRRLTPSAIHTFTMIFTGAAVYMSLLFVMRDEFFLEYSAKPVNYLEGKLRRRRL